MKINRKRFDFIPKRLYDNLDKEVVKKLDDYRENYRLLVLKQKKIDTLKKKLQEQQEERSVLNRQLVIKGGELEWLKNDFQVFFSISRFKSKNNYYHNLCISRVTKGKPKSIGLGRSRKIREVLLSHYKNGKKRSEINKDWKSFVIGECSVGDKYDFIMEKILSNPLGFHNLEISRDDLFPVK